MSRPRSGFFITNVILAIILSITFLTLGMLTWSNISGRLMMEEVHKIEEHLLYTQSEPLEGKLSTIVISPFRSLTIGGFLFSFVHFWLSIIGIIIHKTRDNTILLVFALMLLAIVITHLSWLVLLLKNKNLGVTEVSSYMKPFANYKSLNSYTATTFFSALIMINYKCCGERDFHDVKCSSKSCSTDAYDNEVFHNLSYPLACCQFDEKYNLLDFNCPKKGKLAPWKKTGCKNLLMNIVLIIIKTFAFTSIILIILDILLLVFTILVIREVLITT